MSKFYALWLCLFSFILNIHAPAIDDLNLLEAAVHGKLADDADYRPGIQLPDISPPLEGNEAVQVQAPDVNASFEPGQWDVDESPAVEEETEEWENLPPPSTSMEELMRFSEEIFLEGSEARKELDEREAVAAFRDTKPANSSEEKIEPSAKVFGEFSMDNIIIFNTDDFDDEFSDRDGDAPLAPAI